VTPDWLPPPRDIRLAEGECHVWRLELDPPADAVAARAEVLEQEERARAARFVFERDRVRFVAARAALRAALARYLGIPAAEVRFRYGPRGKPALAQTSDPPLEFNVSHSRGLGLAAFALRSAVGVDVEALRTVIDADRIVERFFSPRERTEYRALPSDRRVEAFFNGWTRKEAYVKALGDGLACPLDSFDVTLTPGAAARLETRGGGRGAWSLHPLTPAPGYTGALVLEGESWQLRCWDGAGLGA
jgi:4'-phosphopantetheinyl transferase